MKRKCIFVLIILAVFGCAAEKSNKSCQLTKMLTDYGKEFNFAYVGNQLSSMTIKIKDREQKVNYAYREDGKLSILSTERGNVEYEYDEKGVLMNIKSKMIHSSRFKYDSSGTIISQKMGLRNFEYTYTNGNPSKIMVKDTKGNLLEEVAISYDQKLNVLSGVGPLGNAYELFYGYPVGNAKNNIVSITTTYKKDSKWKIDGKIRKAGETYEVKSIHEYDSDGNIVSTENEDGVTGSTFQYSCI